MLDTYDFRGDVWLCHSFKGHCHDYTAFVCVFIIHLFFALCFCSFLMGKSELMYVFSPPQQGPAVDTLKEIEAFLSANPSEIVTIILEDYVQAPKGLTKVFTDAGLMRYWFPVSSMPKNGQDWPLVKDMVKNNQRLLVFTSIESKEISEGIAYQWNYMVENQCKIVCSHLVMQYQCIKYLIVSADGDGGMYAGRCPNRKESPSLSNKSRSLVLVNYFRTIPMKELTCIDNSGELMDMLHTCYGAAGNRWANFVAVNYYKV